MDEKEELKQELEQKLQWVKYRQKILHIMEKKLLEMRQIAELAGKENLSPVEIKYLNDKLNNLVEQVNSLDKESKYIEYEVIDE